MDFIFYLPVWQGLIILIFGIVSISILVVYVTRKLIEPHLTKQHERVGRLLFRVSAGLIALLISLSYANERVEYNRVRNSLESEASLIANMYIKLGMHNSAQANVIKEELVQYVEYTIADKWNESNSNPYYSRMTETIIKVSNLAYNLPTDTKTQELLKGLIVGEINEVVKLMQVRFYAKHTLFPFLVYILGTGMFFMWIFFAIYSLDVLSLTFLSLYNTFLIILIYFIIMLSNPLVGSLKIGADAFDVLKTKGIDRMIKQ